MYSPQLDIRFSFHEQFGNSILTTAVYDVLVVVAAADDVAVVIYPTFAVTASAHRQQSWWLWMMRMMVRLVMETTSAVSRELPMVVAYQSILVHNSTKQLISLKLTFQFELNIQLWQLQW